VRDNKKPVIQLSW